MGYKFNGGNGAYICDHCSKTILNYFPTGYLNQFLDVTKTTGRFKGIEIWAREGYSVRFCSAVCLKGFFSEDDSLVNILYTD